MIVERELILSILKSTGDKSVKHERINKDANIPSQVAGKLLRELQKEGLVYLKDGVMEADGPQRLRLTVRAIELGADLERVSSLLDWHEFENIATMAFKQNGYETVQNLRFRHAERRWEIDLVACKKPLAVCVDCKHWKRRMPMSALEKIVEEQAARTAALADWLPNPKMKISCACWNRVHFIPTILTLIPPKLKLCDNVPVVPILQVQDFLQQLPAYVDTLKHFTRSKQTL